MLRPILAATAVLAALAAPSAAHAASPVRYSMFGNAVRCASGGGQVVCGSMRTRETVALFAGQVIRLGRERQHVSHPARPLSVGALWREGDAACIVRPTFVRCWSASSGHGFTVDRSGAIRVS